MTDTPQEIIARAIKQRALEISGTDKSEDWYGAQFAQAAISALKEAGWEITKRPLTPEEVEAVQLGLERGQLWVDSEGHLQAMTAAAIQASTPED